jgi:hypothetical protein
MAKAKRAVAIQHLQQAMGLCSLLAAATADGAAAVEAEAGEGTINLAAEAIGALLNHAWGALTSEEAA